MDTTQQVGGNPGSSRVAHPTELERQLDVARGGEPGQKGSLLEDERQVTVDVGPAARGLLESGEELEQLAHCFAAQWMPHSLTSFSDSHHQRPARSSSPATVGRVHGSQPIDVYPRSYSG